MRTSTSEGLRLKSTELERDGPGGGAKGFSRPSRPPLLRPGPSSLSLHSLLRFIFRGRRPFFFVPEPPTRRSQAPRRVAAAPAVRGARLISFACQRVPLSLCPALPTSPGPDHDISQKLVVIHRTGRSVSDVRRDREEVDDGNCSSLLPCCARELPPSSPGTIQEAEGSL